MGIRVSDFIKIHIHMAQNSSKSLKDLMTRYLHNIVLVK